MTEEADGSGRVHILGPGTLRIDNVQVSDSGAYVCKATPQDGTLPVDMFATLQVIGMLFFSLF